MSIVCPIKGYHLDEVSLRKNMVSQNFAWLALTSWCCKLAIPIKGAFGLYFISCNATKLSIHTFTHL